MARITEAERRAQANRNRERETKRDIAARFLSRNPDGRHLATFPNHFGAMSKGPIDITHLDRHPGLRSAFAFGYVMHSLGVEAADRRYYLNQQLKAGFLRYLEETSLVDLEIGDLTERTLKDFKEWLDDEESTGWSPSELTRRIKIQEVQLVLKQLMADEYWSKQLSPNLKLLEKLYPEANRSIKHTAILDDAMLELLFISAAVACEDIIKRVEAVQSDFDTVVVSGKVTEPEHIHGEAVRCAAFLLHEFGDRPPGWEVIPRKVVWAKNISRDLYEAAIDVLFPQMDELLPFVLLLTTLFAFNAGVVLNMTQDDYEDDWFAGRKRIRLFPYKPRAHGEHRNSVIATEDYDNPARILAFLEKRTARLRKILRIDDFADRVFIRYSWKSRAGIPLEMSDEPWREALERFCDRSNIERFTLKQVRPTTLDLVHEITGGNMMATQQVAGHESPDTTKEYYTSTAMQRRDEEMLAGGINQWWRFLDTEGKVDATMRDRLNVDLGSATPGFGCADPYDSPIEGERTGVLCAAYGRCPMCENALIDRSSPHAYAYQRELLRQIDAAQKTLGPPWIPRWGPVKQVLLTRCLNSFFKETILASGSVSIPDLPPVD